MRISVIIPCYNVVDHLAKAIASVHANHGVEVELILVDDGSTDGTREMLEGLVAGSTFEVIAIYQQHKGASAARNAGMARSTTDYVQFLDADDVLHQGKLLAQLQLAERTDKPDLVIGDYESVMPNGLLLPIQAMYDRAWMGLIKTRLGTTSANLWKREAVLRAGAWPEDLRSSQDYALMYHMLANGASVVWDPVIRTVVLKRVSGSISQTDVPENWDRYVALRREMKLHLQQQDQQRFANEIAALDQYIFMALRIIAAYDRKTAVKEFARTINKGFKPEVSKAITERYVLLYTLLGFGGAERFLDLVGRPQRAPV